MAAAEGDAEREERLNDRLALTDGLLRHPALALLHGHLRRQLPALHNVHAAALDQVLLELLDLAEALLDFPRRAALVRHLERVDGVLLLHLLVGDGLRPALDSAAHGSPEQLFARRHAGAPALCDDRQVLRAEHVGFRQPGAPLRHDIEQHAHGAAAQAHRRREQIVPTLLPSWGELSLSAQQRKAVPLPLPPPFLCYPNEASETSFLPEMCGHG